jgi:hypothetical protein
MFKIIRGYTNVGRMAIDQELAQVWVPIFSGRVVVYGEGGQLPATPPIRLPDEESS